MMIRKWCVQGPAHTPPDRGCGMEMSQCRLGRLFQLFPQYIVVQFIDLTSCTSCTLVARTWAVDAPDCERRGIRSKVNACMGSFRMLV